MKGNFHESDIKLFRDMTAPPEAARSYADEAVAEGTEEMEGGSPEETITFHRHTGIKDSVPESTIRSFTVSTNASLSSTELHRFQNQNAVIVRALAARLSLFLRKEITLEQVSLEVVDLPTYTKQFEAPRHMILFKIHPLEAICVMDFSKPLGLTIADRMLGGLAVSVNPDRPVREVETALVDQIAHLTMREWCNSWKYDEPLRATLVGHEVNPQFLQIGGPEETFYHISIEACIGDCIDQIQMLLPVRGIDAIIRHLAMLTAVETEEEMEEHEEFIRALWNPAYDQVKVRAVAQWPDIPITTRDLSNLKEGDIIPLDSERLRNVEVTLAGKPKFRCRLGSLDQKCAVEIVERIITNTNHGSNR